MSDFCYSYPILKRVIAQAELMDRMMSAIEVNPLVAIRRDGGLGWYEARSRCIECAMSRECKAWQSRLKGTPAKDAPGFCPNHDFFVACRSGTGGDAS